MRFPCYSMCVARKGGATIAPVRGNGNLQLIGETLMKETITSNCQVLFSSNGFRRTFSKKWYAVKVYRDWDANRLIKTLDGKPVATLDIPRNWTDKERGDGRKWKIASVTPCTGLHLTPKVKVTFHDTMLGNRLEREF